MMRKAFHVVIGIGIAAVFASLWETAPRAAEIDGGQRAETRQADIKQLRKEARQRRRRIIFDNDGNEPVYYCKEATPEALLARRTTPLVGSQVDTIFYCTWCSGFSYFTHNTKVGEVFTCTAEQEGKGPGSGFSNNKTADFIAQGTDPLEIVVEFCHANGIEVFWSMRMNDVHDAWGAWYSPFLFPPLKKAHPEYLMGTEEDRPVNGGWTAVDFGHEEIRDLAFRFFEEVCQNYDVDGVQLDFMRHLAYFKAHANGGSVGEEELGMMTGLLARIRRMADEVGAKRGRPILISVRVPDSVELCKAVGLDVVRWIEQDLIDLLVVSGYFRLNPWESSVELGHQFGVPVYPCLSETRLKDEQGRRVRASNESYRARAMEAWQAGVDGIYMFNFFNPNSPLWLELGDVETLRGLDKVYCAGVRGYAGLDFWFEGGERFMHRSLLSPDWPRPLQPGQGESVEVVLGEETGEGPESTVTLQVRFKALAKPGDVALKVNDKELDGGTRSETWIDYRVEPSVLRAGPNRFEIVLRPECDPGPVLEDLLLWFRYGTTGG